MGGWWRKGGRETGRRQACFQVVWQACFQVCFTAVFCGLCAARSCTPHVPARPARPSPAISTTPPTFASLLGAAGASAFFAGVPLSLPDPTANMTVVPGATSTGADDDDDDDAPLTAMLNDQTPSPCFKNMVSSASSVFGSSICCCPSDSGARSYQKSARQQKQRVAGDRIERSLMEWVAPPVAPHLPRGGGRSNPSVAASRFSVGRVDSVMWAGQT